MAGLGYDSFLSSKPYTFLVGPEKREFYIHASLAASKSSVLGAVVNGSKDEATDGYTVWEEVDEDTFVRFGQYVYTGDYEGSPPREPPPAEEATADSGTGEVLEPVTPAEPDADEAVADERASDEAVAYEPVPSRSWGVYSTSRSMKTQCGACGYTETEEKPTDDDDWPFGATEKAVKEDSWGRSSKKDKKKKRLMTEEYSVEPAAVPDAEAEMTPLTRNDAWNAFKVELLQDCGISDDSGSVKPSRPRKMVRSFLQYKQVFLSHARVHVMAVHYEIQPLAELALRKLHKILCKFILHGERISDVVALLRYTYEEGERPQLRKMVSIFAACHFKQLWADSEFRELFSADGALSVAIMENLIKRLD
ncbi:hypothetical protein CCM_09490 [Cordyceps militaris CM01]|uniref:BTB domain-containing protein n=1 Tax=Cordyceps militaris (strain CM01) TaxID=983644 RepID=G3JUR7_CORMM|nr:uncharacterized protein CCM_09490 [Cordyceps militaris CM01]EGX87867.1 hypothetical protein CCM_09490 [Cordyceps militaris CM01]